MSRDPPLLLHLLLLHLSLLRITAAVDFVFNGFDTDPSPLLLHADASIESRHLAITNDSTLSMGRALYRSKVPTKPSKSAASALPFSTSFIFAISPVKTYTPGHGLVFLFAPVPGTMGAVASQHLGLFNRTNDGKSENHVFAVEFDVFSNPEFGDIDGNHVGVDLNSLTSRAAHTAGYYPDNRPASFVNLHLNSGVNYQAWIDYANHILNVTMAPAGVRKPKRPLLSVSDLNLADIFLDDMFVGFCAATGMLVESHRVLAWSFSNSNFSAHEALITANLPSFVPKKENSVFKSRGFIAGLSVAVVLLTVAAISSIWTWRSPRHQRKDEAEEWELQYWPHRIDYQELRAATRGFSKERVIGIGSNGRVYKGVLSGGVEIAIKRITHGSEEGVREFLAEVSSLGRLKHRNIVGLRGWCKRERGSLMLVYDYMANGSLDTWIFDCGEERSLSWEARARVLRDVATAVLYLHEGSDSRVLHRDIKASNVMLDAEMAGRLGDFGLARLQAPAQGATTTRVVGTVGYMAPEVMQRGKASSKTDVFSFGVLVLEVVCGRRPVEDGKPPLLDWARGLLEKGELGTAVDAGIRRRGRLDEEAAERVLRLGLLCCHPDPRARPSMRQVVGALEGPNAAEGGREWEEGLEAALLRKDRDGSSWSKHYGSRRRGHPTFEELRDSLSSSATLSSSDILYEGR